METFYINNRFEVNSALNTVKDQAAGTATRLEPRLMKLLCLLAARPGQVVSREQIIRDIWNDYGGADEGLNQAISFLRKTLQDADKELIRTIPKNGYLLQAAVTFTATAEPSGPATPPRSRPKRYWLIPAAALLVILLVFILRQSPAHKPAVPWEPPGSEPDTGYQYQEMKQQQLRESNR